MSGGKGNSDSVTTVRFAPYIEAAHIEYLENVQNYRTWALMQDEDGEITSNPYKHYSEVEIEAAFFGSGYVISSFPSLYDMFGKFMAGLDIEVLFDQVFEDTVNGQVVSDLISTEADMLSDDLEADAYPRFETGMRDINSVMSSTFLVGRAMMETARTKAISRFSAEFKAKLLPIVTDRWKIHLEWNKQVIEMYAQILKFYVIAKMDSDSHNMEVAAKHALWPFTIMDYERVAVGVLNGATDTTTDVKGASRAAKAIGGAMMGAASGAMVGAEIGSIGGPLGALIGGVIGLAGGLL